MIGNFFLCACVCGMGGGRGITLGGKRHGEGGAVDLWGNCPWGEIDLKPILCAAYAAPLCLSVSFSNHQADCPLAFYFGFVSDVVICKLKEKFRVFHDTMCP